MVHNTHWVVLSAADSIMKLPKGEPICDCCSQNSGVLCAPIHSIGGGGGADGGGDGGGGGPVLLFHQQRRRSPQFQPALEGNPRSVLGSPANNISPRSVTGAHSVTPKRNSTSTEGDRVN